MNRLFTVNNLRIVQCDVIRLGAAASKLFSSLS